MPPQRKRQTQQEKTHSMESAFSQLGWQSSDSGTAQTAPPQLGSLIDYAPDLFGHDEETENPAVDTRANSHGPQSPASPPRHSVRRKSRKIADGLAAAPKRTRGLVTGRKVEKLMKTTGNRITLSYDNFTHGVSGKELCSLAAAQIGKIVRSCVRMTAPNWESLEDAEKFKVIRELLQRNEMLDAINATASDVYSRWKHAMHIHYEEHGACSVPEEFESRKDEWEWLVKHFESPEYQRRSKANKGNRSKKLYHHGSCSCKIIDIAKERRVAGSKFPHIDAGYTAYYRPGRSDDIGSQRAVRMKQLASDAITEAHS